jgi:hypothetical protein
MHVSQIDILVHPDFYQMDTPELPLHSRQIELRKKWDERIKELQKNDEAILIYFSNIPEEKLKQVMKGEAIITNGIERDDLGRIERYKELLGERFILYSKMVPNDGEIKRTFDEKGMTYKADTTKIYPYGEALEACVTAYSWHIKEELQIPNRNFNFNTEDMSLTFADTKEIDIWREHRRKRETDLSSTLTAGQGENFTAVPQRSSAGHSPASKSPGDAHANRFGGGPERVDPMNPHHHQPKSLSEEELDHRFTPMSKYGKGFPGIGKKGGRDDL